MDTDRTIEPINAQQRVARIATDVAVVMLFFSTLMSAWVAAAVSAAALIGLLLYAWFMLRDPARHKFLLLAVGGGPGVGRGRGVSGTHQVSPGPGKGAGSRRRPALLTRRSGAPPRP
jgi:hypothetical protein